MSGQIAYEACRQYLVAAGREFRSVSWEQAEPWVREAWEAAVEAVSCREDALDFLRRSVSENCRIVSTGDLTPLQISEAQRDQRLYVESGSGLGWALLPWDLGTTQDRIRELGAAQN